MIRKIHKAVGLSMVSIAALCVIYIMLATVADVASREIRGSSLAGVVETAEVALVVAVFLSLGYAQKRGQHFAMNLVVDRVPVALSRIMQITSIVLCIGTMVFMSLGLFDRALESILVGEYRFGTVPIPIWPARAAAFLGAVYFTFELIVTLLGLTSASAVIRSDEVEIKHNPSQVHEVKGAQ